MLKNKFYQDVEQAYAHCATPDQLKELLGRARAKKGMFEGDLEEGELEIGQVSALIHDILPAGQIVANLVEEFEQARREVSQFRF